MYVSGQEREGLYTHAHRSYYRKSETWNYFLIRWEFMNLLLKRGSALWICNDVLMSYSCPWKESVYFSFFHVCLMMITDWRFLVLKVRFLSNVNSEKQTNHNLFCYLKLSPSKNSVVKQRSNYYIYVLQLQSSGIAQTASLAWLTGSLYLISLVTPMTFLLHPYLYLLKVKFNFLTQWDNSKKQ